jgi:hypothetical protein
MPLLVLGGSSSATSDGRRYLIGDLPVFNDGDDFLITDVDGWEDPAPPDAALVANGGGPGAVASSVWVPKERALTLSGVVTVPADDQALMRRLLLKAFPADREVPLVGYANGASDVDLQLFVRRYDRPTFQRMPDFMEFTIPLIALDPFKYGLEPLTGTVGVWTGEDWYLAMTNSAGVWNVPMTLSGGAWSATMQQDLPNGPYPISTTLVSAGDVASQRLTFTITGPLDAGDWWIWSETTNEQLWVEVGVTADQTLTLDCQRKTADLSGQDVTHLTYGSWLTLQPGTNSYRLVAGTDSDAFCVVSGLEAYE